MASLPDVDDAGVIHGGHDVVVLDRHGGKGAQHVQLGHGPGGGLNGLHLGAHLLPQGGKQLVFQCRHLVPGGEDGVLQILQFLIDVAFGFTVVCLRTQLSGTSSDWLLATSM